MTGEAVFSASGRMRGVPLAHHGVRHPEDLDALRHGGADALARRRAQDRAVVIEGLLAAALEAIRARRHRHELGPPDATEGRLVALRAAALRSRGEARDMSAREGPTDA